MDLINLLLERFDWEVLVFTGLRILLILILMWGLMLLARLGLRRLERRLVRPGQGADESLTEASKRAETLIRLLRQGIRIVIWVVALLIILRELGVDIAPILASAGIVGLAVGFGAQNLVRDVIAGFFIILENQVRLGDVAIINGTGGLVEAINFRTLVLRDLSGTVHVFPNGTITTLSNMTREWSGYVFDIGVAYKEDVDTVIGIIR
ncbi:MAG TPA: mechanosensitive ion channel domain-containing protein, partial [Thiohalobacter sp.]|nr:mechanosensitive ion channel domain-containing protein [Thiohalobacter sp.]